MNLRKDHSHIHIMRFLSVVVARVDIDSSKLYFGGLVISCHFCELIIATLPHILNAIDSVTYEIVTFDVQCLGPRNDEECSEV